MGRGIGSLGHETSKVSVEAPDILYRSHDSDVSVWPDDDNRTSTAVNPVRRISPSTDIERDADIVNEDPRVLVNFQSQFNGLKKLTLSNAVSKTPEHPGNSPPPSSSRK